MGLAQSTHSSDPIHEDELVDFFRRLNHPNARRYRSQHETFINEHLSAIETFIEKVGRGNSALAAHYWGLVARYGMSKPDIDNPSHRVSNQPLYGKRITSFSLVLNGRAYVAAGCLITVLVAGVVGWIGRVALLKAQDLMESRVESIEAAGQTEGAP